MPINALAAAVLVLAPVTALAAVRGVGPDPPPTPPARHANAPSHRAQPSEAASADRHPERWLAGRNAGRSVPGPTRPSAWIWPLSPRPAVLRRFYVGPYRWSPGHRGVDLATRPGASVVAPAPGVVTFARTVVGRPVIVITHPGGIRTAYEPAQSGVPPGSAVPRGAVVGVVTAAPGHCESRTCIHWSARRGDRYVDPLGLLTPRRIVLLPLSRVPSPDDG